jgi:hypothetical protein
MNNSARLSTRRPYSAAIRFRLGCASDGTSGHIDSSRKVSFSRSRLTMRFIVRSSMAGQRTEIASDVGRQHWHLSGLATYPLR